MNHNAAEWLDVRYLPTFDQFGRRTGYAWFVVRCCPCHWNIRVTLPRATEDAAHRAMAAMLKVAA